MGTKNELKCPVCYELNKKQKKGETIDTCVNAVIMRRIEMPSVSKRQNFISSDGKKWLTKNEKYVIHDLKKADKNVFFDSQNVVKNTQTLSVLLWLLN